VPFGHLRHLASAAVELHAQVELFDVLGALEVFELTEARVGAVAQRDPLVHSQQRLELLENFDKGLICL
jgi:hypothetical protein